MVDLNNRKYTLVWAVLLTATVLTVWDKLTGSLWVDAVSTVVGLYFAANVAQKNIKVGIGSNGSQSSSKKEEAGYQGRSDA